MPFTVSEKLVNLERTTSADIFNAPAERVIAQGRLLLCALSTLAIQFAPTQPTQYAAHATLLLLIYLALAAILVGLTRYRFLTPTLRGAIHVADIVIISALLFLAEGPNSPFFLFFTFALLAAMLRWQWQAVVATAVALTGALLIVSISKVAPMGATRDSAAEIIRGAYLIVAGGLLAYVSTFYRRSRARFAMLAPWPMQKTDEASNPSVPQLLAHSATVLGASRILTIWEEAEEPYVNLIFWREGTYQETRRAAGTFGDLVNPALVDVPFLTGDVGSEFVLLPRGPMRLDEPVINRDLQLEFSIRGVATASFAATSCTGRVFLLDRSDWNDDDLLLTEIIANRVGTELDRNLGQKRTEEIIASQERMRLTRDLHDGILQSLTAAALQLELADSAHNPKARLDLVKRLLTNEQRRIREFVDETFPKPSVQESAILGRDLQRQLEETAEYWNCKTSLTVAPPDAELPETMASELSLMLAEAVANAARHGGASSVDVMMEKSDRSLRINVHDNGKGFNGRPTQTAHQELATTNIRAASLRQRVWALGGSLSISNSPRGAQLAIRLPLP